jgi:Fe-S cluster assembly scaffold protein SufB
VDAGKKAELELRYDNSISLNFIFIAEHASLRLCNTAVSDTMNMVMARLSEGARLDAAFLKHKGAYAYHGLVSEAGTGAAVNTSSFWGGSGFGETFTALKGAGSRALHICLSSTGDSESLSLDSRVSHSSNSTESEVVMRGVAEDSSSTSFKGLVGVESNGRGSRSSLEQQILLLDEEARAETDPILEIRNNDVECSHSAAVRQLAESKLFYLMSRGISRRKAKSTMVMGFLRSAMNRIKGKELRNVFMPPFMRD